MKLLLKIIHKSPGTMNVVLSDDGKLNEFSVDYERLSLSDNLHKDLEWYFQKYLALNTDSDRSVVDRLISYGKSLGDTLLGDDFQLMAYRDRIEEQGYNELVVSIESSHIDFFEQSWESLILPDSKYVLSAVAAGFVRRFSNFSDREENPTIESGNIVEFQLTKESPLYILHGIFCLSQDTEAAPGTTVAYSSAVEQLMYDGAICYEIAPFSDHDELRQCVKSTQDIHIFQYDGPLTYWNGEFYLSPNTPCRESEKRYEGLTLSFLVSQLKESDCGLLVLNATEWQNREETHMSADTGLAKAANIALNAGIPNVLGLNNITDPWTGQHCIQLVYQNIAKGLSLAQSVVEARKALQAQTETNVFSFSSNSTLFQSWPLLVHYERVPVYFFKEKQPTSVITQTGLYAGIRGRMHGFFSDFLPPHATVSTDTIFPGCVAQIIYKNTSSIHIFGGQGTGRTQLLHMLGFYFTIHHFKQAFYFDYADHTYTADQIREMIAPVLQEGNGEDEGKLEIENCIFVFDNLSSDSGSMGNDVASALKNFVVSLISTGNIILSSGSFSRAIIHGSDVGGHVSINTRPFNKNEQMNMLSSVITSNALDAKHEDRSEIDNILDVCAGNPFLLKYITLHYFREAVDESSTLINLYSSGTDLSNCIDRFHEWQWDRMPGYWKYILMLLSDSRSIILEMLAVVIDSKGRPDSISQLLKVIGEPDTSFSEGVSALENSGFAIRYPVGRIINPRCIRFINNKIEEDSFFLSNRIKLKVLISRTICHSLAVVVPEVLRKSDQAIIQNIMANRVQWAKHLDVIWREKYYDEFLVASDSIAALMGQVKLSSEFNQWAFEIISRESNLSFSEEPNQSSFLRAWVRLASQVLHVDGALENTLIQKTASFLDQWIRNQTNAQIDYNPGLFTSIVQFLQKYHFEKGEQRNLQEVCEVALSEYRRNQVWQLVVSTLLLLIESCYKESDKNRAREFEEIIFSDIPVGNFPKEAVCEVKLKIVAMRTSAEDYVAAQALLDEVQDEVESSNYLTQLLDILQADIYYKTQQLEEALSVYTRLKESQEKNSSGDSTFIQERISEIQERLAQEELV